MASPRFPIGTTLSYGDDILSGTPTYTEIPGVTVVGLPFGYSIDEEETTTHDSSGTTLVRRFNATLADRGTVPFELLFDWTDTTHRAITAASFGRTQRAWQAELPALDSSSASGATYEWDGFIKEFPSPPADAQGHLRISASIRVGSDFSFTAEA